VTCPAFQRVALSGAIFFHPHSIFSRVSHRKISLNGLISPTFLSCVASYSATQSTSVFSLSNCPLILRKYVLFTFVFRRRYHSIFVCRRQ